jgi:hypothetical protein
VSSLSSEPGAGNRGAAQIFADDFDRLTTTEEESPVEFYFSAAADLMLTHIPYYCLSDLHIDMGALQAATLMKSKAYDNALLSMVPTILGVEQMVREHGYVFCYTMFFPSFLPSFLPSFSCL